MTTTATGGLSRGAILLAELKGLIDSFPEQRRKETIIVFKIVFEELNQGETHAS